MPHTPPCPTWTRRRLLASLAAPALGWIGACSVRAQQTPEAVEEQHINEVRALAERLGLGPVGVSRTPLYLGLGDASERFRKTALDLCEGLARDYLKHFQDRKFAVEAPKERQVVVLLADPAAFARFLGVASAGPVRGTYDLDTNRLVLCDNRGDANNPMAERANTVTLFHEATHQLSFNTGLLDRQGDVPRAISEGLGMYGETRRPKGQAKLGATNPERLAVLTDAAARGPVAWSTLELLTDDAAFNDPERQQLAYARSWLLVHTLMQTPTRLPGFRAYLAAIRPRRTAEHRQADAEAHLGDLAALDRDLQRAASRRRGTPGRS